MISSVKDGRRRDPFRHLPAYADLLAYLVGQDLRSPLAEQMVTLFVQHDHLTLGEIARLLRDPGAARAARTPSSTHSGDSAAPSVLIPSASSSSATLENAVRSHVRVVDPSTAPPSESPTESSSSFPTSAVLKEAAIREVLTRLFLHRIVEFRETDRTYHLCSGSSLVLRVYYPLVLVVIREKFGGAAEQLALIVHQLGVVPLRSAVKIAVESGAAAWRATALADAALQLLQCGVFQSVLSSGEEKDDEAGSASAPEAQRRRTEHDVVSAATTTGRVVPHTCVRWNTVYLSRLLLHSAVGQLAQERVTDRVMAKAVLDVFFQAEEDEIRHRSGHANAGTASEAGVDELGIPFLPPSVGTHTHSFQSLLQRVQHHHTGSDTNEANEAATTAPEESEGRVWRVVQALTMPTTVSSGLAQRGTAPPLEGLLVYANQEMLLLLDGEKVDDSRPLSHLQRQSEFALHYRGALYGISAAVQEKVVFARHGVLGVRILQLLRRHRFLEDKSIAELVVSSQPRTREVLHDMLRDGLIIQREISRVDINMTSERQPKQQIYLWGLEEADGDRGALPISALLQLRQLVARSLLHALHSLDHRRQSLAASRSALTGHTARGEAGGVGVPQSFSTTPTESNGNSFRELMGLESVVLSHMRILFLLDLGS